MAEPIGSLVLQAVTKLGGLQGTATAVSVADPTLAVERQNVRYWVDNDTIPASHMRIIYKLTGIPVEKFLEHEENRARSKKALL